MFSRLGFSLHSEKCRVNSERALACLVRAVEQARARGWRAAQEANPLVLSLWAEVHGWAGLLIDGLLPERKHRVALRRRAPCGRAPHEAVEGPHAVDPPALRVEAVAESARA